jgi:hypothetical protein
MQMDWTILTETKLTDGIHTRNYEGYQVEGTNARSAHQGGVAFAWHEGPHHRVESVKIFGSDVLTFEIATGLHQWLVIGVYISPNTDARDECNNIIRARNQRDNLPIILTSNLNYDNDNPTNNARNQRIQDCLAILGVDDMTKHFDDASHISTAALGDNTGRGTGKSRCDHFMSDDCRHHFSNIRIADARGYDSDHYAPCVHLNAANKKYHTSYEQRRKAFPIKLNKRRLTLSDGLLEPL